MDKDFKFRTGKFTGKTYEWVSRFQPWYINWVLENRPEMLKEHNKPKHIKDISELEEEDDEGTIKDWQYRKSKLIQPNLDFFNEHGNNQ